jgi:hypothetical protein
MVVQASASPSVHSTPTIAAIDQHTAGPNKSADANHPRLTPTLYPRRAGKPTLLAVRRTLFVTMMAVSVLPLFGCKSKQSVCEHARDRFVEMGQTDRHLAEQDAPDDQKAMAREIGQRFEKALHDRFVAPCLELEGEEFKCMETIDAHADAYVAAQRGLLECGEKYASDEEFLANCEKWSVARKKAVKDYGACTKVLDRIFEKVTF